MSYTITELVFFFLFYSFLGWIMETIFAAANRKRFLNRGFLNGTFCPSYGIGAIIIIVLFNNNNENIIFLFIACTVIATIVEFFTGKVTEKIFKTKTWDYAGHKLTIDGYVCLKFSVMWGALGVLFIKLMHPLIAQLTIKINGLIFFIAVWIVMAIFVLDIFITVSALVYGKKHGKAINDIALQMHENSNKIAEKISNKVRKRLNKAYPNLEKAESATEERDKTKFAAGCGFFKLLWLFIIGAFVGDIVETIFCYITTGTIMSRSSVIYGPFSIVWGLAIAIFTPMLYKFKDKEDRAIFVVGTIIGGVYEYACSVFTEIFFGTVFWDYSDIPFNLGGRINLLYCFFWGIAALVWVKVAYPFLSNIIEKIPKKIGMIASYFIIIFMTFNIIISAAALSRYDERVNNIPADNQVREFLDKHYGDNIIEKIYPNATHK